MKNFELKNCVKNLMKNYGVKNFLRETTFWKNLLKNFVKNFLRETTFWKNFEVKNFRQNSSPQNSLLQSKGEEYSCEESPRETTFWKNFEVKNFCQNSSPQNSSL